MVEEREETVGAIVSIATWLLALASSAIFVFVGPPLTTNVLLIPAARFGIPRPTRSTFSSNLSLYLTAYAPASATCEDTNVVPSRREVPLLAYDYPFLDVLWTLFIIFLWVIWFWILITVFSDLFRRHDIGGGKKVLWIVFVIIAPFLGVLIYLLVNNDGMTERNVKQMQTARSDTDAYIRSVAGSSNPADEIARAKALLDSGAITQAEFDQMKAKALA